MERQYDFEGLCIYDLANNHEGDLEQGMKIIKAVGEVSKKAGVRGALKFQFRQFDTFIHPDYRDKKDIPHIPRFLSNALSNDDFKVLTEEVRNQGMTTICTPFDEESVDVIEDLDIEIIKVASCSATDRPLLERIVETGKPMIISTAGLSEEKIDRMVSFLEHRKVSFALMHCIALYPTPHNQLRLNNIGWLKCRFPHVPIGFSTHEDPDNYFAIKIAYAKGARLFERHVGINGNGSKLNAYSSTPPHLKKWLHAYRESVKACGSRFRSPAPIEETNSLRNLRRGVFAHENIKKGDLVKRDDVFFSMPLQENQLSSDQWFDGIIADDDYSSKTPLSIQLATLEKPKEEQIYQIMLQVKGMLNNAKIFIGADSSIEVSHHMGIERFREYGCVIVNCINRTYCKKLIVQLPRQKNPYHYHKKKEETFQLLRGDLEVELEGKRIKLNVGDTLLVEPGEWHKFHTLDGAIFEEVSTTHYNNDSYYEDERIDRIPREKRKTKLENWAEVIVDRL